ncbi:MAG TPA: VWA domain-containing protein [Chitinophagales bacterium]
MFRFEHKELLWLLALLVPALLLFLYSLNWKKRTIKRLGNPALIAQLSPTQSAKMLVVKFVLLALAFVFLVLALANPQIGTRAEKVKRSGIDIMIALDVSKSMLAEDVQPNRLAKAKNFISHFIDELKNDRLGMIVFAGRAYLQMPQTVDYGAAKMYLKTVSPEQIPTQGTAVELAVHLAQDALSKSEAKSKAVILISDGEDNEEGGLEAIEEAAKNGIKVYTIAVGSEKGAPIPLANGDFKRDGDGNIVLSKVNTDVMRQYAMAGNGKAYLLNNSNDVVRAVLHDLGKLETKDFEELVYTDFDDQFIYFLLVALAFLLVEFFLFEKKIKVA